MVPASGHSHWDKPAGRRRILETEVRNLRSTQIIGRFLVLLLPCLLLMLRQVLMQGFEVGQGRPDLGWHPHARRLFNRNGKLLQYGRIAAQAVGDVNGCGRDGCQTGRRPCRRRR
jgi:hypothetical protein